ncbi:hypothetical protein [Alkalihalobacillus sp. TS-13]|nr:hypothetical protein [Alkalihalobacillus sp. TS-13]
MYNLDKLGLIEPPEYVVKVAKIQKAQNKTTVHFISMLAVPLEIKNE